MTPQDDVMHDERVLLAEAVTGKMAQDFLKSDIGRIITGLNEQDRALAYKQLARTASWRRRRIQELQNAVRFCDQYEERLRALIQRGESAMQELEAREQPTED